MIRTVLTAIAVGMSLAMAPEPAAAQSDRAALTSIFYVVEERGRLDVDGGATTGALADDDFADAEGKPVQVWILDGDPRQPVRLSLQSDEFDPLVRVVGLGLEPGLSDDDSGDSLNSLLCFEMPSTGEARVVVSSVDEALGGFVLEASEANGWPDSACGEDTGRPEASEDPNTFPTEGRVLGDGEQVEGTLGDDDPTYIGSPAQAWAFEARAGQNVTFELRSSDFDAYLIVTGTDVSESNDDGAGGCDSRVTVTFPRTGEYRVIASAIGETGGAFTLSANRATVASSTGCGSYGLDNVDDVEQVGTVGINETVEGTLTGTEPAFQRYPAVGYGFHGLQNQRLAITLSSENTEMDSVVFLGGPGFPTALMADDTGDSNDARLCVELPETGDYTIVAGRYTSEIPADYRLEVSSDTFDCESFETSPLLERDELLRLPTEGRILSVGDEITGELSDGDQHLPNDPDDKRVQPWRLNAIPGTVVYIDLLSDAFDPVLSVAGDELVTSDDYTDDNLNSRVDVVVPNDGMLMVVVKSYEDDGRGAFRLRVSTDPPDLEESALETDEPENETTDRDLLAGIAQDQGHVLEIGMEVDLEFVDDDPVLDNDNRVQAWRLEVPSPQRLVIELSSDELDPIVYLDGPGLDAPVMDDDTGPGTDARLEVMIPQAGPYIVYMGVLDEETGPVRARVLRRRD